MENSSDQTPFPFRIHVSQAQGCQVSDHESSTWNNPESYISAGYGVLGALRMLGGL